VIYIEKILGSILNILYKQLIIRVKDRNGLCYKIDMIMRMDAHIILTDVRAGCKEYI